MSALPSELVEALCNADLEDEDLRTVWHSALGCESRCCPANPCALPQSQMFSVNVWRGLPNEDQERLSKHLPILASAGDIAGQAEYVIEHELGASANRFFGTPLSRFHKALQAGELHADAVAAAEQADEQRQSDWVDLQREHHNNMVHQLHYLKRTWTPPSMGRSKGSKQDETATKAAGSRKSKPSGAGACGAAPGGSGGRKGSKGKNASAATSAQAAAGGLVDMSSAHRGPAFCPSADVGSAGSAASQEAAWAMAQSQGGMQGGAGVSAASTLPHVTNTCGSAPFGTQSCCQPSSADAGAEPMDCAEPIDDGTALGAGGVPLPAGKRPRGQSRAAQETVSAATENEDGCLAKLRFFALVRDAMASVRQELAPAEYIRKQVAVQAQAAGMIASLPQGTLLAQVSALVAAMASSEFISPSGLHSVLAPPATACPALRVSVPLLDANRSTSDPCSSS